MTTDWHQYRTRSIARYHLQNPPQSENIIRCAENIAIPAPDVAPVKKQERRGRPRKNIDMIHRARNVPIHKQRGWPRKAIKKTEFSAQRINELSIETVLVPPSTHVSDHEAPELVYESTPAPVNHVPESATELRWAGCAWNMYDAIAAPIVMIVGDQRADDAMSEGYWRRITQIMVRESPDKVHDPSRKEWATRRFQHLEYLRSVLGDTERRRRYNMLLCHRHVFVHEEKWGVPPRKWLYPRHGGIENTDTAALDEFLDGIANSYMPKDCYVCGYERLPQPAPEQLVFMQNAILKQHNK